MQSKIVRLFNQKNIIVFAIAASLAVIYLPKISLFLSTPMLPVNHELQDPTVSFLSYDPGYRLFQYELFNNKNIWWSNLRGMGLPILGNEVQTAPLFPLVLLLVWVPFEYFWNAFVLLKVILLGVGTLLISRDLLRLKWLSAIFFTILFVYNLYVIRWMNHPWHNGLLAGVWYIYFLGRSVDVFQPNSNDKWISVVLGIAVTAYSMLTCGFPESSAMMAILTVLVLGPYLIYMIIKKKITVLRWIICVATGHAIGFAVAAPQLFSLFEFLSLSERSVRGGFGLRQYGWSDFLPFLAERIIPLSEKQSFIFQNNAIYSGIIPLYFFILGILYLLLRPKEKTIWVFSSILCIVFILFKFFPFSSLFNTVIGSLPILRDCHFFVYFFTPFIFFYSYLSAIGFEKQVLIAPQLNVIKRYKYIAIIIGFIVVICLLTALLLYSNNQDTISLIFQNKNKLILWLSMFLIVIILCLIQIHSALKNKINIVTYVVGILIIFTLVIESKTMLNLNFPDRNIFNSNLRSKTEQLINVLKENNLPAHEVRIIDSFGKYISQGVATIDDGAPPILQERLARFRRATFNVGSGGYLPIKGPKFDHSWEMASVNLMNDDIYYGSTKPVVDWSILKKGDGGKTIVDSLSFGEERQKGSQFWYSGNKGDYIQVSGWSVDSIIKSAEKTKVYLVFVKSDTEITVPTIKTVRADVAGYTKNPQYAHCGYTARIHASLLEPGEYEIILRTIRGDQNSYYEHTPGYELNVISTRSNGHHSRLKYLTNFENKYLYLIQGALSRAYRPERCSYTDDIVQSNEFIKRPGFTPGTVILEELTAKERSICKNLNGPLQQVRILKDEGKSLELENIRGPGIVVLNDNYYPGWQAYDKLTGERLPIRPANLTFRALVLDLEKEYQIRFKYAPEWQIICYLLVCMGIISVFILLVASFRVDTRI